MSYTPPSSDAIDFSIETSTSYSPPSSDAIDLDIGPQNKVLSRSVSLHGDGAIETIRSTTKLRSVSLHGNGSVETTRMATKSRSVTIHSHTGNISLTQDDLLRLRSVSISGSGEVDSTRSKSSKSRSSTVHGNGEVNTTRQKNVERRVEIFGDSQIETVREKSTQRNIEFVFDTGTQVTLFDLQEVFPDEEALDVSWDYEFEPRGFVTEWFDEQSEIPRSERGGFGVTFFGRLENEIELWIQHDTGGTDGEILTSDKQTVSQTQQTVVFDSRREYSDDGLFRVFVRGLRQEDVINQVDVGSVYENL